VYDKSMLLKHNYSENYVASFSHIFFLHRYQNTDTTDLQCSV